MFPDLPEDLTALTDEELSALHDEIQTGGRELLAAARERNAEILGERTQDDVDTELTGAAESLAAIRAEQKSRADDEAAFDAALSTHSQVFETDTEDPDEPEGEEPEGEEETKAEAETVEEPEAVAASAKPRTKRPIPLATARHKPVGPDLDSTGFRSQIRAESMKVAYGDQISDRHMMGEILNFAVKRNVVSPGGSLVVASATIPFDDSRVLGKREDDSVRKIRGIQDAIRTQPEALTASGALCAPLEPLYDIFGVSTAARPVRDALPSFQASRGGVITRAAPSMGVYDDAVGVITSSENEDGSTNVKNCMRLICPDPESVEVASIYRCTEADNLASRSDPELMAAVDELVRAEHARLAETFLIDGIKAGSTHVTGNAGGTGGASWKLLGDAFKAAAAYRDRHRMNPQATLTALVKSWVVDVIALDVARAAFDNNKDAPSRAAVETALRNKFAQAGITVSFYLDGSSDGASGTTGQIFGVQNAGAIDAFPTLTEWFLFAPGTWLHLDSGTLDLGVVRDSVLNSTNDFQVFAEGWENVAFVGVESLCIATAICPNGSFSAGVDLHATC